MGIGPVVDIHSLAMVTPAERAGDLGKVSGAELRHQGRNKEDSPNQQASRGLEEDDAEEDAAREEEHAAAGSALIGSINLFA